jgi:two-component system, NarL family, response regulator LiaR
MTVDDASPRIRVMVVDDHVMVRRGLVILLDTFDDMLLVGEAASGNEAVRLCHELKPHVILMDIVMPDMDGITAIGIIHQMYPDVQIIALSTFQGEEIIDRALSAGAVTYLMKDVMGDEIARAVRDAYRGGNLRSIS